MLVLTRNIGEKIMIGKDVEVIILSLGRHQVRLGINAPPEISVHREEIFNKIHSQELEEI